MTITLPDEWREWLENRAKANHFATVEEYLLSLAEAEEQESDSETNPAGPPGISPRNRAELNSMLDAGMASGEPIRATPGFWEERRRVLEERMSKRSSRAPHVPQHRRELRS